MTVIELTGLPSVGATLANSLTTRKTAPGRAMPELSVVLADHAQSVEAVAAYNRVCGFTLRNTVAPTWLHVLTFGLQTTLMARPEFPFTLPGLVHVSNTMTLLRPVGINERLHLRVQPGHVSAHKRGSLFELVGEVRVGTELVWTGTSSYLARGVTIEGTPAAPPARRELSLDPGTARVAQKWRLSPDLGRRYAAVSGDVNPIHLNPVTARMFGFKTPIAHGMWTHARALAALTTGQTGAHEVSVDFTRPISLPSSVTFSTQSVDEVQEFVVSSKQGKSHLTGWMRAV